MAVIVVTGQTATGKTALAQRLADEHNGELVNYDSRQVYKYLDIITGKDLPASVVHLYDIVEPNEYFSSFEFVEKVRPVIAEIERRGKTPILVGGTYLYLKHLLYGFDVKVAPDPALREKLNRLSASTLQEKLKEIDRRVFEGMNNSDRNNPRRLIRKIEILTGTPQEEVSTTDPIKPTLFVGLRYRKREDLARAIKTRVQSRLDTGAIDEVRSLLKRGYTENDPGLKTIGYNELIKFIKGRLSKEDAIDQWINHEIQYAKRQYTFMKRDGNISWREI